jgi:hypothetical protein
LGLTEGFFCHFVFTIGGLCFGYIECNQKLSQSDLKRPVAATGDIMAVPFARCMERASSVLPQQHYAALCSGRKDTPLFFFATKKFPSICACRRLLTFPKYTFDPA